MMARKPSMADAFAPTAPAGIPMPEPRHPLSSPPPPPPRPKSGGRAGKSGIAFWVDPDAARQLRVIAAEDGRTIQSLMEEALDDLFRKKGKHRLAGSRTTSE